ncbi:hypothetical protein KZ326_08640 [Glaesserella parasuis]|nr:hypothetical protein [Glaesserella parasuis]
MTRTILIAAVGVLTLSSAALWQLNQIKAEQLTQQKHLNQQVTANLQHLQTSLTRYQADKKQLQAQLQTLKTKQRARDNEINQTLSAHKDWANQPVPNGISRLYQTDRH